MNIKEIGVGFFTRPTIASLRYNVTFVIDSCVITTTVEFDEPMSRKQIIKDAADMINADLMLQMDVMDQALDTIVEEL